MQSGSSAAENFQKYIIDLNLNFGFKGAQNLMETGFYISLSSTAPRVPNRTIELHFELNFELYIIDNFSIHKSL
jgi:hypothetical protein